MSYSELDARAELPQADADLPVGKVLATLWALLPAASAVALAWRDPGVEGETGSCVLPADAEALRGHVQLLLAGGDNVVPLPTACLLSWEPEANTRFVIAVDTPEPLPAAQREAWQGTARALVDCALESMRQQQEIEQLRRSRQLQKALFEIADLAGADLAMPELLGYFHRILGSLMYAENCYIVECDEQQQSLKYLYYADTQDAFVPEPGRVYHQAEMPGSLTFAVLREGRLLSGASHTLYAELDYPEDLQEGIESSDWLGVPMWRDNHVCGAIVVQSYAPGSHYGDDERALLSFVAKHILATMDRQQAHLQLEARVLQRTLELEQINSKLQEEILERRRAEQLQAALFTISELAMEETSAGIFHARVHEVIDSLLDASNFYIALVNAEGNGLDFVYSADSMQRERPSRLFTNGLTEYTLRRGKPVLLTQHEIAQLSRKGEVCELGVPAHCWMGVPLLGDNEVVGVIAVQSYCASVTFTSEDQRLLAFAARTISNGLVRQRDRQRLLLAHADLEQRVVERTHELGEVNQKLLSQIGERLRAEQRLTHLAMHDVLTGLPNRLHLQDRLERAFEHAELGIAQDFALLFLDLDRFKWVNDSIGHAAGDQMLIEVARRLVQLVRGDDMVARLGGDEFALLVSCERCGEAAMELGQRLLNALEAPMWVDGRELFPSGSIGIAVWNPRYTSGAEMLRDADAAMYRAKLKGPDRCVMFDGAMHEEAMRSLELEADLRRAINSQHFVPYYQPILSLTDGSVVGHEALLRWEHERRGLLTPGDFLALGEESGLIEQVDWLIYAHVAADLAATCEGYITVNVSPRHFRSVEFSTRLLGLLDAAGADPARLRVELTETALLEDAPRILRTLGQLCERGIMVLLDDFGTGYSALSYLHRFPITGLKVDRSFIAGLHAERGENTYALVHGVLSLARTLGIETIAEGVETEAQLEALQELGCSFAQGYLLGRPAPRERTLFRSAGGDAVGDAVMA